MRTCCSKIVCSAIGSGSHRRSAISRHLVSACTAAGIFECTHRATRTVLGSYRQLWASYHSNGISPDTSHVASTVLDGRVSTANPTEAKLPYLTKQLESEIPDCSDIFGVENSRFLDAKSNIFNDQPFLRPISSSNPTPTSRQEGSTS
ncbi:hypothetical protein BASA62_001925 [Batrachochytrium salamandrivorans]|nr:hypothetical protein BASA62_001925 [Batrachochytrium salamandrivorans]